jgi:hypothetical protein
MLPERAARQRRIHQLSRPFGTDDALRLPLGVGGAIRLDVLVESQHLVRGEVDYYAAIAYREPESAVTSSTHSQWQMHGLAKFESVRDIGGACAANDAGRHPGYCLRPVTHRFSQA